MKSKKKFVVAVLLLCCVFAASILGVTLVFAANQARATTNLNVVYVASPNVYAEITAGYDLWHIDENTISAENESAADTIIQFNGAENYTIYPRSKTTEFNFNQTEIEMYKDNLTVVEFTFVNLSDGGTQHLEVTPTITGANNFTISYAKKNGHGYILNKDTNSGLFEFDSTMTRLTTSPYTVSVYNDNGTHDSGLVSVFILFEPTQSAQNASIVSISWELAMVNNS